jgi:hypothetical protein
MLQPGEADALLRLRQWQREQQRAPQPLRRRQPKVTRHQSGRMRIASSQTVNTVKAIYAPESQWNTTPLAPEDAKLTRNVGPSDMNPNGFYPAKATASTEGGGYPRNRRQQGRKTGTSGNKKRTQADWDALADQYDI